MINIFTHTVDPPNSSEPSVARADETPVSVDALCIRVAVVSISLTFINIYSIAKCVMKYSERLVHAINFYPDR